VRAPGPPPQPSSFLDADRLRMSRTVDDGSSRTLEAVFDHNIFQSFQTAQRVEEHRAQQAPPPLPTYGSAHRKRPAPVDLPPYEHVPRVTIGDTVCIRPKVKKWGANLQFFIESDPSQSDRLAQARPSVPPLTHRLPPNAVAATYNDEAQHIKTVAFLTDQVYSAFDQTAYLASSLAPRKLASLAPHTPCKRASKVSSTSPAIQSGQGLSSELDFSDLLPSSQLSSSAATPTKFRPVRTDR
jgi:hypothetical protein